MVCGRFCCCVALGIAVGGSAVLADISYPLNPESSSECYDVWRERYEGSVSSAHENYYELSRSCEEILDSWPTNDVFERHRQYSSCRKETAEPAWQHWLNLSQQNSAERDICLEQAYAAQARVNEERRARAEADRIARYEQAARNRAASQQVGIQSTVSVIQSAPKRIIYGWGASTTTRLGMNYATGGNWMSSGASPRMRALMGASSILSKLSELQQNWGNLSSAGRLSGSVGLGRDLMNLMANSKGGTTEGRLSAMISTLSIGLILRINEAAQEDLTRSLGTLMENQNFTSTTLNNLRAQESAFNSYLGIEQTTISLPTDDLRAKFDEAQEMIEMQRQNNGISSTLAMQRVADERARAREAARRRAEAARQQAEQERQRQWAQQERQRAEEHQRAETQRRQMETERRRVRRVPPSEPEYTAGDFMLDVARGLSEAYVNGHVQGGDYQGSSCPHSGYGPTSCGKR